jgi:hypothetical protein
MSIPLPNKNPPISRSWWIADNLLAGPYPGNVDETLAIRNLKAIVESGITVFVNLQEPDDLGMNGQPFFDYRSTVSGYAAEQGTDAVFHRIPIPDMGVTSTESYREALDRIDEAHESGRGAYVHCWGGHGRTGTVIGCWLVRHGLTPDEALERITELRKHDSHLVYMGSPQTRKQVKIIRKWVEPGDG